MALNIPPFFVATASPANSDIVSSYPAVEEAFRLMMVSAFGREHDAIDGGANFTAHHKFGSGVSATRDAITDWTIGAIWFNTDSGTPTIQLCTAVGPVVWSNVAAGATYVNPYDANWVTVASASTVDLGAQTTRNINISGTTQITSFGSTATNGAHFYCKATGAFSLKYDATNMILPSAANITCAAGDTFEVIFVATGQALIFNFTRASGQALISSGILSVKTQVFTANGTYTPSTGMLYCTVELVGAGGGSGGIGSTPVSAAIGGGGGGEYRRAIFTAAQIGASKAVTIGAAGTAGSSSGGNGGTGGDTSLGTLLVGKGGSGSAGVNTNTTTNGANGGTGGTGTGESVAGQKGGDGFANSGSHNRQGGFGGAAFIFGCSTPSISWTSGGGAEPATAGFGYGSGASGPTVDGAGGTPQAGSPGAPGYVRITEFCNQ